MWGVELTTPNLPKGAISVTEYAKKFGLCKGVKGVRFKKSTFWAQKAHFLGISYLSKIDPGYGPVLCADPKRIRRMMVEDIMHLECQYPALFRNLTALHGSHDLRANPVIFLKPIHSHSIVTSSFVSSQVCSMSLMIRQYCNLRWVILD